MCGNDRHPPLVIRDSSIYSAEYAVRRSILCRSVELPQNIINKHIRMIFRTKKIEQRSILG